MWVMQMWVMSQRSNRDRFLCELHDSTLGSAGAATSPSVWFRMFLFRCQLNFLSIPKYETNDSSLPPSAEDITQKRVLHAFSPSRLLGSSVWVTVNFPTTSATQLTFQQKHEASLAWNAAVRHGQEMQQTGCHLNLEEKDTRAAFNIRGFLCDGPGD
ncbi:hypothetical protein F2P81_018595 [Scophthalmus maximus]|uniref:Uncharacterized protein n=1 Tax=Scophthalmus maximus TaxID=52904 RepID=A0A6A4SCJ8_SCOMX|nr:hypothetical protein F2P81_018595 [Scophthalmus maximus]